MWVFLSEPNEAVFIKNTLELKWMSTCNSKTISFNILAYSFYIQ